MNVHNGRSEEPRILYNNDYFCPCDKTFGVINIESMPQTFGSLAVICIKKKKNKKNVNFHRSKAIIPFTGAFI